MYAQPVKYVGRNLTQPLKANLSPAVYLNKRRRQIPTIQSFTGHSNDEQY